MAADNIVEQMRMLERDHGGFPVSRLEHSLQTASRAENDGRDEEYVLCALLHDIGDTLAPYNHPSIAAGIVKPFVSEANHWMVEHHGIFQGYYFWHHLGMDRNTRDQYRDVALLRLHRGVLRQVRPDGVRCRLRQRAALALRAADRQVLQTGGLTTRVQGADVTARLSTPSTADPVEFDERYARMPMPPAVCSDAVVSVPWINHDVGIA